MKLLIVAGARPNFMKIAPIIHEIDRRDIHTAILVHTGQHYDEQMSDTFFRELMIPDPDEHLHVGSASHAVQTAKIMISFEPVLERYEPAAVIVVGDVNSTLACALVAAKLGVTVVHVEAGLRSRDRAMPEEINRIATDAVSDLLLTPSEDGDANLMAEGIPPERIRFVGNIMIDTLREQEAMAEPPDVWDVAGLQERGYVLLTMHRPSNVDDAETLQHFLRIFEDVRERYPIVWPLHPRTRGQLVRFGLIEQVVDQDRLFLVDALPYRQNLYMMKRAAAVITDSGGVQEETTALGVPCLTIRENTERPITVTHGTSTLVGSDREAILAVIDGVVEGKDKRGSIPPLWDGKTAARVIDAIEEHHRIVRPR